MLLVSKLDRLSPVVAKIADLIRGGTELRVVECANASTLELHIRAVIAEEERRKIGERTRDALAAAKRNGVQLGSSRPGHWDGREDRRTAGQQLATAKAAAARRELRANTLLPRLADRPAAQGRRLEPAGYRGSLEHRRNHYPPRSSNWQAAQVQRLLASV